ncbi:MAG: CDGSH iron-sulfur domain-containing protein [Gammaproteobacteria bacterium]|nr:CDGSH iron-sulfur domain-containing protein [Gammaproteobacteria bacterium]
MLSSAVNLTARSGHLARHGDKVALCHCGESNNQPSCDGSH